ncbi:MAG: hypothetical protein M1812_004580 [Candelaria pacifica]|nr:MAG: hypothetical protein M1812_004580 [Candelaria pacifica]
MANMTRRIKIKQFFRKIFRSKKTSVPTASSNPQLPQGQHTSSESRDNVDTAQGLPASAPSTSVTDFTGANVSEPQLLDIEDESATELPTPVAPFPFLSLPGELRNKVYQYVVTAVGEDESTIAPKEMHSLFRSGRSRINVAILRTSKQLYEEASPVMYQQNRIVHDFNFTHMPAIRCHKAPALLFAPTILSNLYEYPHPTIFNRFKQFRFRMFFFRVDGREYIASRLKQVCVLLASRKDINEISLEVDFHILNHVDRHPSGWTVPGKLSVAELGNVINHLTLLKKMRKVEIRGAIREEDARSLEAKMT